MDLPPVKKLSLPYFLLQSLIECSTKLNAGIPDQLAHHGLIKLLVEDALHTYTIPIAWDIFINMSRDDDIKTLAKDINPSGSQEEEEEIGEEGHEETPHMKIVEEQEIEEEQEAEEKLEKPTTKNKTTPRQRKGKEQEARRKSLRKSKRGLPQAREGT